MSVSEKKNHPVVSGEIIKGKYEVRRLLGQGGFGAVYEVFDPNEKDGYAMKIDLEISKEDEPDINAETVILKRLQSSPQVCRYIDHGTQGPYSFVIMQLVGKNLSDLRRSMPHAKFTVSTSTRISAQCLEAIESVHNLDLLHRDIKPANFAIGKTQRDCRTVYILDFGLVRKYRMKTGEIRQPRKRVAFRGTIKYASVNAHNSIELGRVDDVWSWLYMSVEFRKAELPWRGEKSRTVVGVMKATMKTQLLDGLEPEYSAIYDSLLNFKYPDEPLYKLYKTLLNNVFAKTFLHQDSPFDWEAGGVSYSESKSIQSQPNQMLPPKEKQKTVREKMKDDESSE